jgi:hypothetical protein
MKTLLLASVCLASLAACDRFKSTPEEDAAAAAAATPPEAASLAAPVAAPVVGTATGAGAVGATPTPGATATTATTVANGDKKVVTATGPNGTTLKLQNDAGKGSVSTGSGGVNVQGKSGKAITIPTSIPGLPVAK